MWHKYLSLATFAYNTFHSPNLGNYSPFELTLGREPRILLNVETNPDVRISDTYKDYHTPLTKRLKYLQNMLQNFKAKHIALINKDREYFQYNPEGLVYLISPLTTQLRINSRKVSIKYVGPLVIYKIIDPHNYLLMTIDGQLLRGIFEHERLKPAVIKTDKVNVTTLTALKRIKDSEITPTYIKITYIFIYFRDQKPLINTYLFISGPKKPLINTYLSVSGPKSCKLMHIYQFQDQNHKLITIYIFQNQICKPITIYIFQDQKLLTNTNICISEPYFPSNNFSILQDQSL